MKDNVLISALIIPKALTPKEILEALVNGKKIKLIKAKKGCNYWLENNELKSNSITYLKSIPMSWFNSDIKYEIDD